MRIPQFLLCRMDDTEAKNVDAARQVILGAICGDIIGSWYESNATNNVDFTLFHRNSRFTDDTVCTIAIADALIDGRPFGPVIRQWCRQYPRAGYGGMFRRWMYSESMEPYNSWGNGSAMRVSAVGAYGDSFDVVLELARQTAEVTHNHPEGIKGAQATTAAIYLALTGKSKNDIRLIIEGITGYNLGRTCDDLRPRYGFEVSCQKSVPESIIAFLDSTDYESAIRNAISLGGDADTMGAIAGGIAAAYYGEIPAHILDGCMARLPNDMKAVIDRFNAAIVK